MPSTLSNKQDLPAKHSIFNEIFYKSHHHSQTSQNPFNLKSLQNKAQPTNPKSVKNSQIHHFPKWQVTTKNTTNHLDSRPTTKDTRVKCKHYNSEIIKRQEDLLLQVYTRLAEQDKLKKWAAKTLIDKEYEKLQKKYCPNFKLINNSAKSYDKKQNFGQIKKNATNQSRSSNQRISNNQDKSKWNFKTSDSQPLKTPKQETVLKVENLSTTADDSDKTLTPGEPTDNTTQFEESTAKHKPETKDPDLLQKILTQDEINYPQMQQIFYHQPVIKTSPSCYNLIKNKQDHLRLELKEAIILGKSVDPILNKQLANVIEEALNENIPWSTIQAIINDIKNYNSKQKVLHLIQMTLKQKVFIICTVRTCNFSKLLCLLDRIMNPLKVQFSPILQHFQHCCVIEALVPQHYLQLETKEMRQHLNRDTEIFRVKRIDVVDVEHGEVSVQCLPVSMPNTTKCMENKGYTILNSDYGFRANKEIILDNKTMADYRKFIKYLLDIPDIETISDNVLN